MAGAFLILLREGFESALIVGIILAVLARIDALRYVRHVLAGVALAAVASIGFAFAADWVTDLFGGAGQEVINGAILVLAAAMITYVVVWLKNARQGIDRQIANEVHRRVGTPAEGHAVAAARGAGILALAFLSVFREGVETVLFLWGILAAGREEAARVFLGGMLGLAAAVAVAWLLFQGGRRVPVGLFFQATTALLVLLAAGMLAHGAGLWVAVDWLPALLQSVWDTSGVLDERSGLGSVLAIMIGYNANPTLMEVLIYFGYLGGVTLWLWLDARRPRAGSGPAAAPTS